MAQPRHAKQIQVWSVIDKTKHHQCWGSVLKKSCTNLIFQQKIWSWYSYLFWCPSSESNNPVENWHHLCVDNIDLYIIDTLRKRGQRGCLGSPGGSGVDSTAVSIFVDMLVELTITVFVNSTNIATNIETAVLSKAGLNGSTATLDGSSDNL